MLLFETDIRIRLPSIRAVNGQSIVTVSLICKEAK